MMYSVFNNGEMAIFVTNNNDFFVPEVKLQVLYKNGDQIVGTEEETIHGLTPHQTSIGVANANYESADSYTVTTDISNWSDFYKGWGDGVSIEVNIGENNNIVTTVKNNNNLDLDTLQYTILLYKGGELEKILNIQYILDLKAGEEKIDTWDTSYDDFMIFIGDAYSIKY